MKLYAMQGVSATRDFIIFDEDGIVVAYFEGKGANTMPTICKDVVGKNVNEFCEGLLDAVMA
jgi:DNA-binding ferritin-like protein (Dps family)